MLQMGFRGQFDEEAWIDWQKAGGGDLDVGGGRVSMYEMTSTVVEDSTMSGRGYSGTRRNDGRRASRRAAVRDGQAAGGETSVSGGSRRTAKMGHRDHRGGSAADSLRIPRAAASSINYVDEYGYIGSVAGAEMRRPRGREKKLSMSGGAAAAHDDDDVDHHHHHHRRHAEDEKRVQPESLAPGVERLRGVSPPPLRDGGHSPPLAWSSGGGISTEKYGRFGRFGSASGRGRGLDRWVENQLSMSNDSPK